MLITVPNLHLLREPSITDARSKPVASNIVSLSGRLPLRRNPVGPNGVVGMVIFIFMETMLFAGFISAFTIVKTTALVAWPPPNQVRLPIEATAANTTVLFLSGVLFYLAGKHFKREDGAGPLVKTKKMLVGAIAAGSVFVLVQGAEWVALISQGLPLPSSTHAGFFYLIVGCHALHAVAALGAMFYVYKQLIAEKLEYVQLATAQLFWLFVVGIWPILYMRVYL